MNTSILDLLKQEEDFIYDNYDNFVETFCRNDVMDMYQVSFASENVYFNYVLDCGQHISNSMSITAYNEWKETLKGS